MHKDSKKHDTPTDANNVLADVKVLNSKAKKTIANFKDRHIFETFTERLKGRGFTNIQIAIVCDVIDDTCLNCFGKSRCYCMRDD